MAEKQPPDTVQVEAHVAAGTPVNVLRRSVAICGVVLWPSWQAPPVDAPADKIDRTGTIQNHWRYAPGVLAPPPTTAPWNATWMVTEQIHEGDYAYDARHPGTPLPNVDIDLFHASADVDFDDYDAFSRFYTDDDEREPRVEKLRIKLTAVDAYDDKEWLGAGEAVFEASIDGHSVGKTAEMKVRSGQHGVTLAWKDARSAVVEVDAAGRSAPITITISGVELDTLSRESMGSITAEIAPPWPVGVTMGTATGKSFAVHWKIEPVLMTEEDRAATPPAAGPVGLPQDELREALIASRTTAADGRFEFRGLRAGDYVLFARGRFAFVENDAAGGEVGPAASRHHNGVQVAALGGLHGHHRLHVKLRVDADGGVKLLTTTSGAETPFATHRLLAPGQALGDIRADTPYRFYVLPLVAASNAAQWAACAEELRRAYNVTLAQARTAMQAAAILDVAALQTWECASPSQPANAVSVIAAGAPTRELLEQTLLLQGAAGEARTMAYDHVNWLFTAQDAVAKTHGRFVPLSDEGFFSGANCLYGLAAKTKDTYGRYALRYVAPSLDGRDIRELKTRLVLWGSGTEFVNLTNDEFDRAMREALLRFKHDRELFRRRVNAATGTPDPASSTITTIVDADTYAALDAALPSLGLDDAADTVIAGTPMLNAEGYSRLTLYAVEIARRRIASQRVINVTSPFRTLAHNRRVYLGNNNLRWRLASNAPAQPFTYSVYTTTVMGVTGADGSTHAAGDMVTTTTFQVDEPRGTYISAGQGDTWAPDYSKHTRGTAIDFRLDTQPAAVPTSIADVQWCTNAIVLFGAFRNQDGAGRLWLEPMRNPPTASSGYGTTTWIHLDTGGVPLACIEFVLTDRDVLGPRWNAKLIARGRVTQAGVARLGARVRLLDGATVLAETYTDTEGHYSLRAQAGAVGAGYMIEATFERPYAFQPPQPAVQAVSSSIAVAFTYAGDEVTAPDIDLRAAP